MARTVFILGAGASKTAGTPLMAEFINRADDLRAERPSEISKADFDLVFDLIQNRLTQLYANSVVDLSDIESVFSLVEMGLLVGRLPGTEPEKIKVLSKAMRTVLVETIENYCQFEFKEGQWIPSLPHLCLADYAESLQDRSGDSVAFITFNYDLVLDFALHWSNLKLDYALGSQSGDSVPILKLHGSLNWASCTGCREIVPISLKSVLPKRYVPSTKRVKWPVRARAASRRLGSIVRGNLSAENLHSCRLLGTRPNTMSSLLAFGTARHRSFPRLRKCS